jgi:hypothetical protein
VFTCSEPALQLKYLIVGCLSETDVWCEVFECFRDDNLYKRSEVDGVVQCEVAAKDEKRARSAKALDVIDRKCGGKEREDNLRGLD